MTTVLNIADMPDQAYLNGVIDGVVRSGAVDHSDVMIVGASCRDIWHSALGHSYVLAGTHDVDIAVAVHGWTRYRELIADLPQVGSTGIRFLINGVPVDLMPFGEVEEPAGVVEPFPRNEPMSVWAFSEVFKASHGLRLIGDRQVRIPSTIGYAALKCGAWVDRIQYGQDKDARDLATTFSWHIADGGVTDRLYSTELGQAVLEDSVWDIRSAAVQMLGAEIRELVGGLRIAELWDKWDGAKDAIFARGISRARDPGLPGEEMDCLELVAAFRKGLFSPAR